MDIYIFDLDKTLFNTLDKDDGVLLYKEKFGCDFVGDAWYTKHISLDMDFYKPILIDDTYKWYLKALESSDKKIFILTGRDNRQSMHQCVVELLETYDIEYDKLFCKPYKTDTLKYKLKIFNEIYMENRKKCNNFYIFDDRDSHRAEFLKWCKDAESYNPHTKFYFIDSNTNTLIYGNKN